jgi:hypothetical protein
MTMNDQFTRKEFLRQSGKYAAGIAVGTGAISLLSNATGKAGPNSTPWPWPYQKLDVEAVRILGHDAYYSKGCCYGAFHALMQSLRDLVGEPFMSLPSEIMVFGSGGGAGWGLTCGAANGSAALISLVRDQAKTSTLVSELFGWYTQTKFPTDMSNQLGVDQKYTVNKYTQTLAQNTAGSVLCHISVTDWCVAANIKASDAARKERCARLTGDVAAYAAQILNDDTDGTFTPLYVKPTTVDGCMTCHGSSGVMANVSSSMECTQCHGDPHSASGIVTPIVGGATAFALDSNYPNPFNPTTTIGFAVPHQANVTLDVYDVHGRLVRTLIAGDQYTTGRYSVRWDGTNNGGQRVASGIYFARMQAGTYAATKKMVLEK